MIDPSELRPFFPPTLREPRAFFAPGRVNFIGEHTDYNDGFVLPLALDLGITVLGTPRDDHKLHARSQNGNTFVEMEVDLRAPGSGRTGSWTNYVEGIAQSLIAAGFAIGGAELVIASDLPAGAGLSSSAALEMSVGFALLSLSGLPVDPIALALAGQTTEHQWAGTRCGIMDQLVSARARRGSALFIDCRSLDMRDIPFDEPSLTILVADTRVKHTLATSAYNRRREECEQSLTLLREGLPEIRALRDVDPDDFAAQSFRLPEPLLRRARHVVTENDRVRQTVELLEQKRFVEVGQLLVDSHRSLQHDYEVSCRELDLLVEVAITQPGVFGARMTGGGFGGSIVCLVESNALEHIEAALSSNFRREFGRAPWFVVTNGGQGAFEIVA